jgi:hypothetical protein
MEILPPPGPERRRQILRLALLLGVLVAVLWYVSDPAVSPRPASDPRTAGAATAPGQLPVPDTLRLDTLRVAPGGDEPGRNPFVFGQRAQPSAPGSSFLTTPQPAPVPVVPPPPLAPQGPPPIALRLTGMTVVATGGRTLVTLKDPTSNVLYQAFEGDIVDGRYRVVRVGVQSVVVSYLDGSGLRTLPLGG